MPYSHQLAFPPFNCGQVGDAAPISEAPWSVVFAEEAINDLMLITNVLTQSYCGFGDPPAEANQNAQVRIEAIIAADERLATAPF